MTKVDIRRLDSVTTNDTTATQLINENFEALQEAIENTISRDGTTPNFMDADLDLNSYKIINAGTPTNNTDVITKEYFDEYVGDVAGFAEAAEASANRASTAAQAAQGYSTAASGAADVAQRARDFIESDPGFQVVSTDLLLGDNGEIHKVNANKTNIDTVADSITNVNTVSADIANVNAVADDLTNIDNIVTNMTDINNVADDLTKIVAVADDLTKIDNVADDLTNIDNVADDLTNIDAVADNITNVNAVANNETNINAVNANKTNIDTVATNIADVNSVGTDIAKVTAVADDLTNIDAVVENATNINAVAGDITNINAVAADLTNIDNASAYAAEAKQWAIGDPTEPADGSAKYWAGQAAAGQINSNYTENDPTSKAYILNKPTAGDNISLANNQISAVSDASPTQYSTNLVQSGGVFTVANSLQQQIDAIVTSSDVFDIVADYAALQAYDITTVPVNDIVKVLTDSTHNGAATYYRCTESGGVKSWSYVGSEGPYYTKGEADATFQATLVSGTNIKTINNNSILGSGNVNIDSLPSQTGHSGKFLTTNGTDASWENVPTRNIGEIVESTIPLTDAGLHLLDGTLISGSGSYSAFVTYMANLYNTAAKVSNISVIGTLTDNNGVISGFSTDNYATFSGTVPDITSFEQIIKIKTSNVTTIQCFSGGNSYKSLGSLQITANSTIRAYVSSNGTSNDIINGTESSLTVQANTDYWVKYYWDGTTYKIELSTDGETYTNCLSVTNSNKPSFDGLIGLGLNLGISPINQPLLGSIDLNESYIDINGSRWWTGRQPISFTEEAGWQQSVTDYGVCGKFVYDSVNNTVRLPKYGNQMWTGNGEVPVKGNGLALGLTSGTTESPVNLGTSSSASSTHNALFMHEDAYGKSLGQTTSGTGYYGSSKYIVGVTEDATKSGIIADLSDITTIGYWYIVIATSTKTDIEVDIDEVMTDLNLVSNQYRYDGQWVSSGMSLASNFSFSDDTRYEFDLSTYLPNDNYNYEVLGTIYCNTLTTSGKYVNMFLYSSLITGVSIGTAVTRTSSYMRFGSSFVVPVGTDRKIALADTGNGGTIVGFSLAAYRRIGTNS